MSKPFDMAEAVREIRFEVKQYQSNMLVDPELFAEYDFRRHAVHMMIQGYIASITRTVKVTAPATRWDLAKEFFLPKWTRKWLPVHYRNLSAEAVAMLPAKDIADIRKTRDIRIAVFDSANWWTDNGSDE